MRLTIALGFVLALLVASTASARSDSDSDSDRRHRVKQVEVTNFPATQEVTGSVGVTGSVEVTNQPAVQDVFVTNPTEGGRHTPFQLVGFTEATYQGGETRFGFTRACQVEFPNSRMCTFAEVIKTVKIDSATGLIGEAWVNPGPPDPALLVSAVLDCEQWTSSEGEDFEFCPPAGPCRFPPDVDPRDWSAEQLLEWFRTCTPPPPPPCSLAHDGPSGSSVDLNGTSGSAFCSESLPVACCALVP